MSSVILGGTFSSLHAGHRRLLAAAKTYSAVYVGVTTDALAARLGHRGCPPARVRLRGLKAELRRLGLLSRCRIFPITDRMGPAAAMPELSAIIVSPETEPVAKKINVARLLHRRRPLQIVVVPYCLAEDGLPVSSTRIRAGDIDAEGRRRAPLRVAVGSDNPVKISGVKSAFSKAFPRMKLAVRGFKVSSGVHEQPVGFAATWKGAQNRAAAAAALARKAARVKTAGTSRLPPLPDYCVGLESGLIPFGGRHFDIQFCALSGGTGVSAGSSMGFPIPQKVEEHIFGKSRLPLSPPKSSMGDVVSALSRIHEIGRKGGAIAYLSGGLLQRQQMVEQAVLCAFVERRSPI
ncbi:MAG: pantetheine-phosphate adenylyltransferase [Candidatus Micrarchaeota archaeon]|nr:pantetheine-phosphate adenylyltransferase [Candidatus Micrarchaeota archaeon]